MQALFFLPYGVFFFIIVPLELFNHKIHSKTEAYDSFHVRSDNFKNNLNFFFLLKPCWHLGRNNLHGISLQREAVTPQLVSHFMNFSFISKHEGCAESDPSSSKLSCSYDLKYEVRSNERKYLMADKFVITANPTECNRIPSFNKIVFIFNDKIQCTNRGWKGMCATAIHAFICSLLRRKQEAKCCLLELLVSFWVAAFEKRSLLRAEKRAQASTVAQTFDWLPSLPSHGLEWVTRPPGL